MQGSPSLFVLVCTATPAPTDAARANATAVRTSGADRWMSTPARCHLRGTNSPLLNVSNLPGVQVCDALSKHPPSAGAPDKRADRAHGQWTLNTGGCYFLDVGLATAIAAFVREEGHVHATLTELGAGLGCYAAVLASCGVRIVAAVDGAVDIERQTGGRVQRWDLAEPMDALADWVLSLEVAEHLPPRYQAAFVDNLVENARCGVILSWSDSRQGSGHVNVRSASYVTDLMLHNGFKHAEQHSATLRQAAGVSWLQRNVRVYERGNASETCHRQRRGHADGETLGLCCGAAGA